ncbi:MAG: hypothetical protein K6G91_11440 [Kiritimatiellae bacterium]|nr:hypothetical protein [Kiritimatiellia bacterium]
MDELIYRMEELANKKAFPQLLKTIVLLVDENLRLKVMLKQPLPEKCGCICEHPDLVLDGGMPRKIRTRLGVVELPRTTRVKCKHCGKTFVPLALMCGLEKHQTMSNELAKLVLEQCAQESYRVAAGNIHEMTAAKECHSTFRRWVLKTDADEISVPEGTMGSVPGVLYADGTKCKSIGADGHACKGDVKVLLGVRNEGTVFPIGTWTGHETWQEISDQLAKRQVKFPDGTILVCDGEIGLAESLSKLASDEQRCQWHVVHDTYHAMWQDGGRMPDVRPVQDRLKRIMAIELPKESFETVSGEKKDALRKKTEEAEKEMDELIGEVRRGGFEKTGDYLERAKSAMFNYVRRWLALGIACPRASSFIERTMRELGLRLKKMAYGWKDAGLNKVSSILLKMFADDESWQAYWKEHMNINQAVFMYFKLIKS